MKISCLLTTYNRPRLVQRAIESVLVQTHQDWELFVLDDNSRESVPVPDDPRVKYFNSGVTREDRFKKNRISVQINERIKDLTGDLVCYLSDDDFYLPGWFAAASRFFDENPQAAVGVGRLYYNDRYDETALTFVKLPETPVREIKKFGEPVELWSYDHNQVIHRRDVFNVGYNGIGWPEDRRTIGGPDSYFFQALSRVYAFYPIDHPVGVKCCHKKNLQILAPQYLAGTLEEERE